MNAKTGYNDVDTMAPTTFRLANSTGTTRDFDVDTTNAATWLSIDISLNTSTGLNPLFAHMGSTPQFNIYINEAITDVRNTMKVTGTIDGYALPGKRRFILPMSAFDNRALCHEWLHAFGSWPDFWTGHHQNLMSDGGNAGTDVDAHEKDAYINGTVYLPSFF
jgi:hypothetical protein